MLTKFFTELISLHRLHNFTNTSSFCFRLKSFNLIFFIFPGLIALPSMVNFPIEQKIQGDRQIQILFEDKLKVLSVWRFLSYSWTVKHRSIDRFWRIAYFRIVNYE